MIRDPGLMGGYKTIIAQKPPLWKAENVANDTNRAPCPAVARSDRKGRGGG
jgi:hypothetical protein